MSYELTIQPLGQTIEVEDGQTILDAALRAGIYLPHACCHGLCATCKVQVVDGEVEHGEASAFALMDFEREEQKCLACCATLQSDVTIEADIDEDAKLDELDRNSDADFEPDRLDMADGPDDRYHSGTGEMIDDESYDNYLDNNSGNYWNG